MVQCKKYHQLFAYVMIAVKQPSGLSWYMATSRSSTPSCHEIWYLPRNQFCRKGCCTSCSRALCWHTHECLARKVKFHQSSMWEGVSAAASPAHVAWPCNEYYTYVCIFFFCVCSIYIYSAAKVPATSGSFPFKRSAMASKEYWAQMVALWPGNECVQQFNPQAPFFIWACCDQLCDFPLFHSITLGFP